MEPAARVPDSLGELRVLQQRVRSRRIKRRHAHIHRREREHAPQALRPEVFTRAAPDAVQGMDFQTREYKARGDQVPVAREILLQDVGDAELVVLVRLAQPGEIPVEAVFALPALNLRFHAREVC